MTNEAPLEFSQIQRAIQELEDMAYHPSLKKELSTESLAVILRALKEL